MNKNVGFVDRFIRAFAGIVLIGLAAAGVIGWWGYIGIVPLFTAVVSWCPAYTVLGMSTKGKEESGESH
ncbi:MAG: YgaP family membrane protein [Pseudomonadota bacterium]